MDEPDPEGRTRRHVEICLRQIGNRQLIGRHIGFALSADPVWDMLLDLYLSRHLSKDIAISSLASAANVPPTTALRCIKAMLAQGLVYREADATDGRRIYIRLTARACEALTAIFDAMAERDADRAS